MIPIKTEKEIELIKNACRIVSKVLKHLKELLRPGITTAFLDKEAEQLFKKLDSESAFKGYKGFPANICTSINEAVVHGVPGVKKIQSGDILSVDVGAKLNGYFGDAACTAAVGNISENAKKLLAAGKEALKNGISKAREGNHLSDISAAIQTTVENANFSVVRNFVGHGIGAKMHEEPEIPNFGHQGRGPLLKAGMVLAIEPMLNEGTCAIEVLKDNWTAVTKDKKLSAHFEHTICITKNGPVVLTDW